MLRCLLLIGAFGFVVSVHAKHLDVAISAESAIVINADTGAVLYEKNADTPYFPASITKVATALYALHLQGDQLEKLMTADRESLASIGSEAKKKSNYTLPSYWLETNGTHIGLKNEEQMTFKDLLSGMLISSGNDAANVIARESGGTISAFMEGMNTFLKENGCTKTFFCNPHGLHHPKHTTTARDMALVTAKAMKYPVFREIVKSDRYNRPKTNKQAEIVLAQGNHLVNRRKTAYYDKAIGVKTGFTSDAKSTLIAAAKSGKRTLIAVLLRNSSRADCASDAKRLFETAFNESKLERILVASGPQEHTYTLAGAAAPIETYVAESATIRFYPSEEPQLQGILKWNDISPPVAKDQKVGEIQIQNSQGKVIHAVPLLAKDAVSETWFHWVTRLTGS